MKLTSNHFKLYKLCREEDDYRRKPMKPLIQRGSKVELSSISNHAQFEGYDFTGAVGIVNDVVNYIAYITFPSNHQMELKASIKLHNGTEFILKKAKFYVHCRIR